MFLALLQFELHIPGATSIKDKRSVVRSVKDRLHREHQVSVAEVKYLDSMNVAGMALVLVNREARYAQEVLDRIQGKLKGWPDARLGECFVEIIPANALPTAFLGDDGTPLWDERDKRESDNE